MKKKRTSSPMLNPGFGAHSTALTVEPLPAASYGTRQYWLIWLISLIVAFVVQLSTLDLFLLHKDESQIIDFGRLALNPHSDWAVAWRIAEGKPTILWSYLGPLIAELSFQVSGLSNLGPRIASLLGGLAAGTMALGWLLARRVPAYAAFGLCLAFMLDPLFILSQRIGRLDSWVIAICLACCWLLRRETIKKNDFFSKRRVMAAGALAAVAGLIWPSAVFLYPLIILELFHLAKPEKAVASRSKYIASLIFYFASGGLVIFMLLLIPIWQNLMIIFRDMSAIVTQNADSSKLPQDRIFSLFNIQHWYSVIKSFVGTFSPLFPLLAIAGVLLRLEKGLLLAFIITVYLIFASFVYQLRLLYLLPYFLAFSGNIFQKSAENRSNLLLKKFSITALTILVIWSIGISLLVRTAFGLEGKAERDPNKIYQAAASSVGTGNYKVFLGFTYEFYFVGRSLGWKLYTPYVQTIIDSNGNWLHDKDYEPKDKFIKLLSNMDYAIFSLGAINEELAEQLAVSGLHYNSTLCVNSECISRGSPTPQSSIKDVLLWNLRGPASYDTYVLYSRDQVGKSGKVSLR